MKFYRNIFFNGWEWTNKTLNSLVYIKRLWAHYRIYMTQRAHFVEQLCDRTGAFGPKVVRHLAKLCDNFHSRTGR